VICGRHFYVIKSIANDRVDSSCLYQTFVYCHIAPVNAYVHNTYPCRLIHFGYVSKPTVQSQASISMGIHHKSRSVRVGDKQTSNDNGEDHEDDGQPGRHQRYSGYCENCGVCCDEDGDHACYHRRLCYNCMRMRECCRCRRHLPDVCFADVNQNTCEACKDRTTRRYQRRQTALCQRIAEVDFNVDSRHNGTYEEAFRSLATDISSTIQHQLDIYG